MSQRLTLFLLFIGLLAPAQSQISISSSGSTGTGVNANGAYVQNFNSLSTTGNTTWTNNSTLPGWYTASGTSDPNTEYTSIVASSPNIAGNPAGTLYSMPQHFDNNTANSSFRALGFAPSGATGNGHAALRFVNNTGSILTGITVSFEIRWGYSQDNGVDSFSIISGGSGYTTPPTVFVMPSPGGGNATANATINSSGNLNAITKTASGSGYTLAPSIVLESTSGTGASARAVMKLASSTNSVTLSAKTFNSGAGTLSNFSTAGWTPITSITNSNTTTSAVPDDWNYVNQTLSNLTILPGQEIWLDWQFKKEGTLGSSVIALDNVRVYDFAKGDPAITTQPTPQAIILGNSAKLSVAASGTNNLTYQWRKNGSNISGANASSYTIANAQPSDAGGYDVVVTSGGNSITSTIASVQVYTRTGVRGPTASAEVAGTPSVSYTQDTSLGNLTITNTAGYTNSFDLYLPNTQAASGTRPALLVIHGGGGNDGDKSDTREVQACIEFASHGYAALSINYKKSYKTSSSGTWSTAWPQNIKDAKTAVRWLRAHANEYGINPNRIGAIGFSWGGNEASMLALTDGDASLDPSLEDGLGSQSAKVQCAANFYGAVQIPDYHNMNQFSGNGVPGSAGTMDYTSGTNNYLSASPASRASLNASPILLCHGDADLEVMPTQNFALKAALLNAGASVQGVTLQPGGLHSYALYDLFHNSIAGTTTDVRPSTIGFFDRYLQPFAPLITSASNISGAAGTSFNYQITGNNLPTLFSASGLPQGITLNSTTGILTGTLPGTKGTSTITITASGHYGTATTTVTLISTDSITVTSAIEGTTPDALGYNLGHFMITGDAPDWFRYSGVKAARVFISASEIQGSTSPGKTKVTSLASLNNNISSTRALGTSNSTYIKWSDFNYNYVSTNGSNTINYKDAFGTLTNLGVEILTNITCSPTTFPLSSATDYPGLWEIWQHYYAQAYLLASDYGIHRFSMFNEPNNWTGESEPDWLIRLRYCSDAIQAAISDVNAAKGKNLTAQIYAPNTASGQSKYNTSTDTWGHDAVINRHLKLNGSSDPSWLNFHFYNYQKYSMLTNDNGGLTGYIEDIDTLANYLNSDIPTESRPPLVLTEFNVRTGSSYDTTSATQDDATDSVALGANCIALTQHAASQLYLFKFGQTEDTTSPYGLAKNGTHYVDNISSACNYGSATRTAEVYRLFNKAAQGGRTRFASTATTGANSSSTSGIWRLMTQDSVTGNYYIYLANKNSNSIQLSINLAAWNIPTGNPLVVEEVSSTCRGGVSQLSNVKGGQAYLGAIPAESVWLITIPNVATRLATSAAFEDTQVGDGASASISGGSQTSLLIRSDGTIDGRKAVLIKIPTPIGTTSTLKSILLDVGVATTSGATPIQAHVYGLTNDTWTESGSTWSSLTSVLKQGLSAGSQIAQNAAINTGATPVAKMLGQIVMNSTMTSRRTIDVTDFVKSRSGGYASFLIIQEHRWNYSADLTTTRTIGDIQPAGLVITSKEKTGAGPRLIILQSESPLSPPVVLSNPIDQFINLGGTINLNATVDGSGIVSYQWIKDGSPISGATGPTLVITSAGIADAGNYALQISNTAGTTTSASGAVTVNAAPILSMPLKNVTAYVADTVTLTAAFTGSPPPTYQWTKDGATIPNATDPSFVFIPTSTTESGNYTVTANNTYGKSTSSSIVTINPAPTSFLNISNGAFSYNQNFDALEKSGTTYSVKTGGNSYATWIDGNTNFTGWYATTDRAFSGYRTVNNSSSADINIPVTTDQSGLMSMGSSSSSTDRSFGGIPWSDNRIYQGIRFRNSTSKTITICNLTFVVEQFTSTSVGKNDTMMTLASQTGAISLKAGTWITQASFTPQVTSATYARINGTSSSNRSAKAVTLTNLNVTPGTDLWLRWMTSSTSSEPVALAIDDLVFNGVQLSNNPQTITFTLSKSTMKWGESVPTVVATSSSSLPVILTSSDNNIVAIGTNGVLNIVGTGTVTLTANQLGDADYFAATPISRTLTISPTGPTFESSFPGESFTSDADGDGISALMEYVLGGTSTFNDSAKLPQISLQGNSATMTVIERTNDPTLTITAEASTDLKFSPPLYPSPIRSEAIDQNGVPSGFRRINYTLNNLQTQRLFLRLKATLVPL
ncbi:MAG: immunoglobulin domain-containing protein [Akkermansiaceae bacterium]|nr:immunoglobulin domain-containing protein [Akkermansiaceae bacterium]